MPKKKDNKEDKKYDKKCRHEEYYDMQSTLDGLYAKSKDGGTFDELMPLILSRENILLAYRNIRANKGGMTAIRAGLPALEEAL